MINVYLIGDHDARQTPNRRASRSERKSAFIEARLTPLQLIIDVCRAIGDETFCKAFTFWIVSLSNRGMTFDRSVPRYIKLPHVLREACGLPSQDVLLDIDDKVYALSAGTPVLLLYSPNS